MKALLIEDDRVIAAAVSLILTTTGFRVDTTNLGAEGVDWAMRRDYSVILLDLNLPDTMGYNVLKELRDAKIDTPILILSGNSDSWAKVCCLGLGADDYITKPFHPEELACRIKAVVRRSLGRMPSLLTVGKLTINLDIRVAEFGKVTLPLTSTEFEILRLLALWKGTTLTKEMLLNHLYGGREERSAKIIDVFICKLRKKLAESFDGADYIETVRGVGYAMRDPGDPRRARRQSPPSGSLPERSAGHDHAAPTRTAVLESAAC